MKRYIPGVSSALFAFGLAVLALPAFASASVVYNAIPDPLAPHYPSEAFQATQTSEFGDYVHLGGTDRQLTTVSVTMDDWAIATSDANLAFCAANAGNCDDTGYFWPLTINVYASTTGANGVPNDLLATQTVTAHIPWRPAEDPTNCPTKDSPGYAFKYKASNGNCYNGIASNVTFDFTSQNITLPDDVIIGIAYNTETYGPHPVGVDGPYDSLNVAVPSNDPVTVGTDDNATEIFQNTATASNYTDGGAGGVGIFRKDTNWGANGTVAFQIDAASPVVTPSVTTNDADAVAATSVTLNGTNGPASADNTSFWWGTSSAGPFSPGTDPGSSEFPPTGWSHDSGLGGASSNQAFNEPLMGLTPNTTYYFVAWVQSGGTWYPGDVLQFTTADGPTPSVTTDAATSVSTGGATLNGTDGSVDADNTSFWWGTTPLPGTLTSGADPASFEFPASGWSHDSGLGPISASGDFSSAVTGLTANTPYYVVAWVHANGVWYPGNVQTFTTAALTGTGEIRGSVFEDWDGDSSPFETQWEDGLKGWTVYLDMDNSGGLSTGDISTTTDKKGRYSFTGLAAASYAVREVEKPGWIPTYPSTADASESYSVNLAGGQIAKKKDFGNFELGSISGTVFEDKNGNGKQGGNEGGLSGWTVNLLKGTTVVTTMTTDASGKYSFPDLGPGTYKVTEVLQGGWKRTTDNPDPIRITSDKDAKNKDFGNKQTNH